MKKLLLLFILISSFQVNAQIIYDPTIIHAGPGEFYHPGHVYTIELEFYDPNYHAILKAWKEAYNESTLPAKLDYGIYHFDSVAVKYKGNSTFAVPTAFGNQKVPYNIDLNDYVGGQDIEGYKKFKLGNCWFDPTFSKEVMGSFIYKQYMPCYEANLIRLVVNGNYLGIYVNEEDVGAPFLKKHFGEKDGVFFKCEPMPEDQAGHPVDLPTLLWEGNDTLNYFESYERKSDTGWVQLLNFINILNNDPASLESVINIDRVLWFFAVSQVISNEDTYNTSIIHNYYLYRTADGKFQIIPWDLTESFCGILFGGDPASHYEMDPLYGYTPYTVERPLVYQIMANDYYRKRYFAHVRTIINEYYDATWIKNWILDLQDVAYDAVESDPNRPHNMTKFVENVDNPVNYLLIYTIAGITDVITNRKPYLQNYPDIIAAAPVISNINQNIQHPSSSETVTVSASVSNATNISLRVTNNPEKFASDFISISMLDDGLNGDFAAGDGIFTATIPFNTSGDHIKYYIEAENAAALALMPERAEYFYYHYYVDEVIGNTELADQKRISIYPNPAVSYFNITPPSDELGYQLKIYTTGGQLVYSENNLNGNTSIDASAFAKGNYIVELWQGNQKHIEKLLISP